MKKIDLLVEIDRNQVLKSVGCGPDNPMYSDLHHTYNQMKTLFWQTAALKGEWRQIKGVEIAGFSTHGRLVAVAFTLGNEINARIKDCFANGSYMEGMLLDSIATAALFSMDKKIMEVIEKEWENQKLRPVKKYTPGDNCPLDLLNIIVSITGGDISLSSDNVMSPLKSMAYFLEMGEGDKTDCVTNKCQTCAMENCVFRENEVFQVEIINDNTRYVANTGENLFDLLIKHGYFIDNGCGKKGLCGQCGLWVDQEFILACTYTISKNIQVRLPPYIFRNQNDNGYSHYYSHSNVFNFEKNKFQLQKVGFAVDIGTTTIDMALLSMPDGTVIDTVSFLNQQRVFGADVISRIQSANEGNLEAISTGIQKQLADAISGLLAKHNIEVDQMEKIVIASNTAMAYFLLGYSCETLGIHPYKPNREMKKYYSAKSIFGEDIIFDCPCLIVPFISAFVGGDIVAGIIKQQKASRRFLLVDIGTNGEIALYDHGRIIVTSAAAGPAFEGGNIRWGTGGIPGAIVHVDYLPELDQFFYETIDKKTPVGICGSGIIDITAALLNHGFMDDTGLLREPYFSAGVAIAPGIYFYQEDIRQVQMAKGALCAGMKIILEEGTGIDQLFIAGGMGHHMNVKNAAIIGLLPKNTPVKVDLCGNTALDGAINLLLTNNTQEEIGDILIAAKEINLSNHPKFQQYYIENMNF